MQMPTSAQDDFHQSPLIHGEDGHKPEILILDEPMNGLDPIGINEMREYLVNLCKEGAIAAYR